MYVGVAYIKRVKNKSAIFVAATMTSCSTAVLAAKRMLLI